ncbi:hypothetical protein WICPIJ_006410 [Wickerhamomyces pijperi]|uniref:Ribosomal RNA-processing protein 9 n=1 Tax=Wickerhamomyces pijperi TaxID=599730 RepID=A0A9P8TKW4_WICPI|nr:hypothetical protein WICPIJ_006410 [Wickerhamomyces pijperi]
MAGDSFFSDPKSKKRVRASKTTSLVSRKKGKTQASSVTPERDSLGDEEISGISGSEDEQGNVSYDEQDNEDDEEDKELDSEEEFEGESAADKRRRLAKQYLENLQNETNTMKYGEYAFDAKDLDDELITSRLKEDVAEQKGFVYRYIADKFLLDEAKSQTTRIGSKGLTGVAVRFPYAYTVSKDMELIKWDIRDFSKKPQRIRHVKGGKKYQEIRTEVQYNGHCDEILAVAVSPDGRFVVTGGRDKRIIVWSSEALAPIKVLPTKDRRGEILGLTFRRNSDQLFVACADLKVRTYSISQFAQLETLYGHEDLVADIAALGQERCVTVGARDRTAMLWKIADETRLTFRGGDTAPKKRGKKDIEEEEEEETEEPEFYAEGSIDCVTMVDDSHFITGSDNGSVSLWSLAKKKPIFTQYLAHGLSATMADTSASGEASEELRKLQVPKPLPYWITALHSVPYSDIFFSGSWDGSIRLWKLHENMRSFECIKKFEGVKGLVTRIDVCEQGKHGKESFRVVASVSKEHRLGRWCDVGKNGVRNSLWSAVIEQQVL